MEVSTCRDSAAEQAHSFERRLPVDLHDAGGVEDGVLGKGRRVEEVVDRAALSVGSLHGEPGAAVADHHALERIHAIIGAKVRLLRHAIRAFAALSREYRHHMVPFLHVLHSFAHALHHPIIIQFN